MLLKNEAKVGLLVFGAIIALIGMYWFLRGLGLGTSTFTAYAVFNDARKLDKGADVRMAGVKVGYVDQIRLTTGSRARVDIMLWDDTCVPHDSVARITTGAFIGDYYVDVLPGSERACLKNGQRITSAEPMNYEKLVSNVGDLIDELKISVASINSVLADKKTVQSFKNTVEQLDAATKSAVQLVDSVRGVVNQASPDIKRSLGNMAQATDNAIKLTNDLRSMVNNEAKPDVHKILAQADECMTSLNSTILEAKGILTKVGGNSGKIESALTKLDDAMGETDEMMKNLKEASGDIKGITSDPEIKKNIKDTMRNAAEATAQANALLCNINKKVNGLKLPGSTRKAEIPNYGLTTDSLWNTSQGSYRVDANYTFGGFSGSNMFYRLGAFNVGENTSANIQAGMLLGNTTAVRGGIYASRVGLGLDQRIGKSFLLSADGLRPNDPEYDLRAVLTLGSGFGLYGGYSNIINDKPDTFVGVHYSR